jgi:methylphosphotriester-DNA--protein-cysteine methyltransferase
MKQLDVAKRYVRLWLDRQAKQTCFDAFGDPLFFTHENRLTPLPELAQKSRENVWKSLEETELSIKRYNRMMSL